MSKKPAEYSRRILVAVSGLTPAILTETLYALAVAREDAFIPTEIHLITTGTGARLAEDRLLKPETGKFYQLCRDYHLPAIQFSRDNIHVITDGDGRPMDDIRLPEDNELAADFIVEKVREFTEDDEGTAVHVSIAGGRKTMGYYVGYALSLFGREQDRLSHVLVEDAYEKCPDFMYPSPTSTIAVTREGTPLDLSKGKVYLAEIPFVRLRSHLPKSAVKKDPLIQGKSSFSDVVNLAAVAHVVPPLIINPSEERTLQIGFKECKWEGGDLILAFYLWMIQETVFEQNTIVIPPEQNSDDENDIKLRQRYAEGFLAVYEKLSPWRAEDMLQKSFRKGMDKAFFEEKKSLVATNLKKMFGTQIEERYGIKTYRGAPTTFSVDLGSEQIRILNQN